MPHRGDLSEVHHGILTALDRALRTVAEPTVHDLAMAEQLDQTLRRADHLPMHDAACDVLLAAADRCQNRAGQQLPPLLAAARQRVFPDEVTHHAGLACAALLLARRVATGELPLPSAHRTLTEHARHRAADDPSTAIWYAFQATAITCTWHTKMASADQEPHDHATRGHIEDIAELLGIAPPAAA